eukprot:4403291-Prymnesium_polylepis.1
MVGCLCGVLFVACTNVQRVGLIARTQGVRGTRRIRAKNKSGRVGCTMCCRSCSVCLHSSLLLSYQRGGKEGQELSLAGFLGGAAAPHSYANLQQSLNRVDSHI